MTEAPQQSESVLDRNAARLRAMALRQQLAKLSRRDELRTAYGLHFYRPHWKQHSFHEAADCQGRYARFANRTGKTICGSAESVATCLGERPWYRCKFPIMGRRQHNGVWEDFQVGFHDGYEHHPLVTKGIPQRPGGQGILVVSDWDKAHEIFTNRNGSGDNIGELFKFIPHEALGHVHTSRGGHVDQIEIKRKPEHGGGSWLLRIETVESWKHNRLAVESSKYDFAHFDEPPPHEMFLGISRGFVDRGGKFWINATPIMEQWINDEFCPADMSNVTVANEGIRFRKNDKGGIRFIITATIWENPFVSDQGRDDFEATLTEEQRECRLEGIPMNLAGLIYKDFRYDIHVLREKPRGWDDLHLPPSNYTIRNAWDQHDAIPQAILFAATAPTQEAFIYDELFFDKDIGTNAKLVKEKIAGRNCVDSIIDPRAVIESPVTHKSVLDTLDEYGLYYEPGSKDMTTGINLTRERLRERRADGGATIYITANCKNTIREIMRYCYNPKTQKPLDKDDHMMENLRRLIINGLEYVEPNEFVYRRKPTRIGFAEDRF